jgi:Xaa-Pro dipeptidase
VTEGLIYLVGLPTEVYGDSDMGPQFRQRRYFYYLSGVDFEDCTLAYDIGRDHLQLFIPPVNRRTVVWMGTTPGIEECEEKYDVDEVALTTNINEYILKWLQNSSVRRKIYVLHSDQCPPLFDSGNYSNSNEILNTDLLQPAMDSARVTKTEHEIKLLRIANKITAAAHLSVLKGIRRFKNESEIEATFLATCVAAQAKHQSYNIIAASGENPSILHYSKNDECLDGRQLVCLDAGCEWQCYASDVTRTFPISGRYSKEAKAIYDIVASAQEGYICQMKPGASFHDLNRGVDITLTKGLLEVGLLRNGSIEECLAVGVQAAFFPHGVSLCFYVVILSSDLLSKSSKLLDILTYR